RPAADLRTLRPEIPEALAAIVARCLARDRDARFRTAAEVAKALLPFAPERARETVERAESMATLFRRSLANVDLTPDGNVGGPASVTRAARRPPPGAVQVSANVAAASRSPAPAAAEVQGTAETHPTTGLFVRATPASARITIDGVPVPGNPYHGQYPRNEVHVVEVLAPGYDSKSEQVFLANDVFIDVSLDWHVMTSRRSASPPAIALLHRAGRPGLGSDPAAGAVAGGSDSETSPGGLEVDPTGGHVVV